MEKTAVFDKLMLVEAEWPGLRRPATVLVLGEGGDWIDPLAQREGSCDQRIVDFYHAAEHLYDAAQAPCGNQTPRTRTLGEWLEAWLWDGQLDQVMTINGSRARTDSGADPPWRRSPPYGTCGPPKTTAGPATGPHAPPTNRSPEVSHTRPG